MKTLTPAEGWVVVQMEAAKEITDGGIIKPVSVVERERAADSEEPPAFRVLSIPVFEGTGVTQKDVFLMYPQVGDLVLVHAKAGACLRYGKDLWLVRLDSIMASVTGDGTEN